MQTKTNTLTKDQINAVAHNIIVDKVLQSVWDFTTNLAYMQEFDYAFTNTATEDYCDTSWHTTQNVKLYKSLQHCDAEDMYETAKAHFDNFVNVNLATVTVEEIFTTFDDISGDTAMRDEYYTKLHMHFEDFANANKNFKFTCDEYYNYSFTSTHTFADKKALVLDYLDKYSAEEYIEINNEIAY